MIVLIFAAGMFLPLLLWYGIYRQDIFTNRATDYNMIGCYIWGLLVMTLSGYFHRWLVSDAQVIDFQALSYYIAPIDEEILKSLIMIFLASKARLVNYVDGISYGFTVGIGFAIAENLSYLVLIPELELAFHRSFGATLMHATTTGLVGIAFGLAVTRSRQDRIMLILSGLILAILIHMSFNISVSTFTTGVRGYVGALLGLFGSGLMLWAIRRGVADQRRWVENALDDGEHFTDLERSLIWQLGNIDKIMKPLVSQFGYKEVLRAKAYLNALTRQVIIRQVITDTTDTRMRSRLQAKALQLQNEIDADKQDIAVMLDALTA